MASEHIDGATHAVKDGLCYMEGRCGISLAQSGHACIPSYLGHVRRLNLFDGDAGDWRFILCAARVFSDGDHVQQKRHVLARIPFSTSSSAVGLCETAWSSLSWQPGEMGLSI